MTEVGIKAVVFSVLLFMSNGCGFRYNHEDRLASMVPYKDMEIPFNTAQMGKQLKTLPPQKFLLAHSGLIVGVNGAQASPTVTTEKQGDGYTLKFKWKKDEIKPKGNKVGVDIGGGVLVGFGVLVAVGLDISVGV